MYVKNRDAWQINDGTFLSLVNSYGDKQWKIQRRACYALKPPPPPLWPNSKKDWLYASFFKLCPILHRSKSTDYRIKLNLETKLKLHSYERNWTEEWAERYHSQMNKQAQELTWKETNACGFKEYQIAKIISRAEDIWTWEPHVCTSRQGVRVGWGQY